MVLAFWVVLSTLKGLWLKMSTCSGIRGVPRGYHGMVLGHLGIAVFIVGVTLTSLYSTEKDVRLNAGEAYELGGYRFTFQGVREFSGPNYRAREGHVVISRDGEAVTELFPQKRIYFVQRMPMTEAGIDAGLTRDLFVALGEPLGGEGAWSLRLYHKPFVRWIWLGGLLMALGGLLAASDRRYLTMARRAARDRLSNRMISESA